MQRKLKLVVLAMGSAILLNSNLTVKATEHNSYKATAGVSDYLCRLSSTASIEEKTEVVYSNDITYIYDSLGSEANIIGYYLFNNPIEIKPSNDNNYYEVEHDDGRTAYIKASDTLETEHTSVINHVFRNNYFKSFMGYNTFGRKSNQYRLQRMAITDNMGMRTVNGRYCVALGTAYANDVGRYFDIVLQNGVTIPCVLGDVKADIHTDKNNTYTVANGCMSEFIVDVSRLNSKAKQSGNISKLYDTWDSGIAQIIVYDYNCLK